MIGEIIHNYMMENRRLVVPGLGAFIRKDDGTLVLTELLRTDDGVLVSLVRQAAGYTLPEAQATVEAFAVDLRQGASSPSGVLLDRVGVITLDAKGQFSLDASAEAREKYLQRAAGKEDSSGQSGKKASKREADFRNQNAIFVQTDKHVKSKDPKKNVIRYGRSRTIDLVIAIAVVAIVIALGVIVYSALNDPMLGL